MQFKDKELWEKSLANNEQGRIDDYGGSGHFFAELWALLMEAAMANGQTLEQCAEECSSRADSIMGKYGMTGFQYGCAVGLLSKVWLHGEELRRWHNLKTQIGDEGEKANESGGALNPALINILL